MSLKIIKHLGKSCRTTMKKIPFLFLATDGSLVKEAITNCMEEVEIQKRDFKILSDTLVIYIKENCFRYDLDGEIFCCIFHSG